MTDQEREILVHRLVGGWALDYHVLMPSGALDVIEHRLVAYFCDIERDAARQEREQCVAICRALADTWPVMSAERQVLCQVSDLLLT
jgi:hypothetical protein